MIADQVDDGVGQLGAFGDLDALKIPSAGNVVARLVIKLRERSFDRLGMFVKPCHPERQPSVPSLQGPDAQAGVTVLHGDAAVCARRRGLAAAARRTEKCSPLWFK
jgi:hypothetical protein